MTVLSSLVPGTKDNKYQNNQLAEVSTYFQEQMNVARSFIYIVLVLVSCFLFVHLFLT